MQMNDALLIVEDEQQLALVLKEILEPQVPNISLAKNGAEALETLKSQPNIRAILSDIYMPVMDGLELLKQIRSAYNPIPFVVLTSYGSPESMRSAIQLNATDFLEKPINSDELIKVVTRAMEYGVELAKLELAIEEKYKGSENENLTFLKRLKRTTMAMRIENSIYLKKAT